MGRYLVGVVVQSAQVVERGRPQSSQVWIRLMNMSPTRAPFCRLVEEGVLAMQDRLLQRPLAEVVVQRRAGRVKEQRQLLPVLEHVADRSAQGGVRLDPLFVELAAQVSREAGHRWLALDPMKLQDVLRRQLRCTRSRRCDRRPSALPARSGTPRESDRRRPRTGADHAPGSWRRSFPAPASDCDTTRRTSGSAARAPRPDVAARPTGSRRRAGDR